jgi:hypothetical protein
MKAHPLLRHRSERPCDTRAKKRDELTSPHRFSRCRYRMAPLRLSRSRRAAIDRSRRLRVQTLHFCDVRVVSAFRAIATKSPPFRHFGL